MAIDGKVYAGSQAQFGFSEESTFGTAIADNQGFTVFECVPPSVDFGLLVDHEMKHNGTRVKYASDGYVSQKGGLKVLTFSDLICHRTSVAELLYAVLQNCSEGAADPYTKTYALDAATTQPDFASNEGFFVTLGIKDSLANYHRKYPSAILRTLTLSSDLTGDGRLRASGEWISGFAATHTSNFTGTWTQPSSNYFEFNSMTTKQLESTDIVVYGWDITIANNAIRIGNNSSGYAESYALGNPYIVTGNIVLKYDSATDTIINDLVAGNERKLQLAVGTGGAAGHLDFTMNKIAYTGVSMDYGRPEGRAVSLAYEAKYDDSGSADLLTVTLSDGVDKAW